MTSGNEIPEISYKTQVLPDEDEGAAPVSEMAARIERLLCENTEREIAAGTTLYGVHRDDLVIKLNGREAKSYASPGADAEPLACDEACGGRDCGGVRRRISGVSSR